MIAVLLAGGGALATFIVHLIIWQLYVPRHASRTLVAIFILGLMATLAAGLLLVPGYGLASATYTAALYGILSLTYLLLYTGVECDSPTLTLAHFIAQAGATGRTAEEIERFVHRRPFVKSRLAQLEAGGFVVRTDAGLVLGRSTGLVLDLNQYYRALMGRVTRGG